MAELKGLYEGTIEGFAIGESPEKKTPYAEFKVHLDSRIPTEGQKEPIPEKTIYTKVWLTEGAFDKAQSKERLEAAGFAGGRLSEFKPEGNRVKIWAGGKDAYDFQISVPGSGKSSTMETDKNVARKVDSLFADRFKSVKPAETKQETVTQPDDNETSPFDY